MVTGTFTYNALHTKTPKEGIKTKKNCKSFKLDKSNAVGAGTTAIKPYLSICPAGVVWFARYCGKMYSRHLFSYSGLLQRVRSSNQTETEETLKFNSTRLILFQKFN